jgi:hypothetical protein
MKSLLTRALALGCAARTGYSLRPSYDYLHTGLFYALFSCLLAVMVWGVFLLLGLHRLPRPRALAAGAISVLVWALLLAGLMAALGRFDGQRERERLEENYTEAAPHSTRVLQRTRSSRRGCDPRVPWDGSLSLGR